MQKEKLGVNMQLAEDSKACIPEYKIAGGVCSNTAKSLKDVSIVKNRVRGSAEKNLNFNLRKYVNLTLFSVTYATMQHKVVRA